MATSKQLAANRTNARKSTGPKTDAGKAVAKMNAVKHGLLARHVVLQGQHDHEQVREFEQLHRRYWEHYTPVGPVEEMLVERIVTTYWRLHRVLIAEGGEIALNVDQGHWQRHQPDRLAQQILLAGLSPLHDATFKLEQSVSGLRYLRHKLQNVRRAVERDGELTEAALQLTHIAGQPNVLTEALTRLGAFLVPDADGLDAAALKAKRRDAILVSIDGLLTEYYRKEEGVAAREQAEEEARQAAAHLPTANTLDKILRYETTLERQLYRAMNQLERLQRMRQGEVVPAPLTMDLNGEGRADEK